MTVAGSTEAAADLRDGGLVGGGVASGFAVADAVRCILTGREVDTGVDVAETALG